MSNETEGEVIQGTINVIGRLSRSMDDRIEAELEVRMMVNWLQIS